MFNGTWSTGSIAPAPAPAPSGGWSTGPAPAPTTSGGWSFAPAPAPDSGGGSGGGWSFAPAPAPAPSGSYGGSYYYYSAAPGGGSYSPGGGITAGPFGEGTFTPLDFPLMKSLRPGERLEGFNSSNVLNGLTGTDKVLLAVLIGLVVLKKKR